MARSIRSRLEKLERKIPKKPIVVLINPTCQEYREAQARHRRGELSLFMSYCLKGDPSKGEQPRGSADEAKA
jgi:hypothetical protein